ncbi:MAG TPA: HIT domain-containing protein [Gammaproteobacteria bacterium]|nr:HIT domain-containing protein [Gammaproteobacteria bacterium]
MKLHPQLEKDCLLLGEFTLCSLLLLNDSHYPWFILLPNRENITELHQLTEPEQQQLMRESMYLSRCLEQVFHPDKLNIATLGNLVPQLHIHHIARFTTDISWPAPVWGNVAATTYSSEQTMQLRDQLIRWFEQNPEQAFHRQRDLFID